MPNAYKSSIAGAVGNAKAVDVLAGKTFSNDDGIEIAGSMTNRGSVSKYLNPNDSYTIVQGYHDGTGKVKANPNVGTFTPQGDNEAIDMGIANTYRYVNTHNVYSEGVNKGYRDGVNQGYHDGRASMIGELKYGSFVQLGNNRSENVHSYQFTPTKDGILIYSACSTGRQSGIDAITTMYVKVNGVERELVYSNRDIWQVGSSLITHINPNDTVECYAKIVQHAEYYDLISCGMWVFYIS